MMLDLKEKIGYLKKFKCGIFTTVWCYFLKILVKRVKHFFWKKLLECSAPAAGMETLFLGKKVAGREVAGGC